MNHMKQLLFIASWVMVGCALMAPCFAQSQPIPAPERGHVEYVTNPLGIDTPSPRFGWWMVHPDNDQKQTAYQILVASDVETLSNDTGNVWDTEKIQSDKNVHIVYAGKPLESFTRYFWKVRLWDAQDRASAYSMPMYFETALLQSSDFKAQWIQGVGKDVGDISPILRKEIDVTKKIKSARAYVSGMGYYELFINNQRVGNNIIDPADTLRSKRVLYSVQDVTSLLKDGKNALGMRLGHGWHKSPHSCAGWLQLRVVYDDNTVDTIITDTTWRTSTGGIVLESLYDGEEWNDQLEKTGWLTAGYDDSSWAQAVAYETPPPVMSSQIMPPIRVVGERAPSSIKKLPDGKYIVDFGQNLTGWVNIHADGPAGTEIVIRHAELLYDDGTLNPENLRKAECTDKYIMGGGAKSYEPHFTQHGFRYAEVSGYPGELTKDKLVAKIFYTDLKKVGTFECSNPLFNKIHEITQWSVLANNMSHPTDCPQRDERMGWMGDAHLAAETTILNYDVAAYYESWLRVIADSQGVSGGIPDTCPPREYGDADGSPPWSIAYPLVTWYTYRYYGDTRVVEEHYPNIVRWLATLDKKAKDNIVEHCPYGDWVGVEETSGPMIGTGCYYWTAKILREFALVLGKADDARLYGAKMDEIASAYNTHFLNREKGFYTDPAFEAKPTETEEQKIAKNATQFAQILPLYLGIVPDNARESVLAHLKKEIVEKRDGHIATGILGAKYIFPVLSESGNVDVAYGLTLKEDYPGWGFMIANGATTLWELWKKETGNGMNSHNHQMFGAVDDWFYSSVGGINTLPEPGFSRFIIAPQPGGGLTTAQARVETVKGVASCSWRLLTDGITLTIEIPANSHAKVIVPTIGKSQPAIILNGQIIPEGKINWSNDLPVLELGSGKYVIDVK